MTGMNEVLAHVRQQATSANVLGSLLWWELGKNHIAHDIVEQIGKEENLEKEYLPSQIRPITSFRRAIQRARMRLPEKLEIKKVFDNKSELVLALARVIPNEADRSVSTETLADIAFQKASPHDIFYATRHADAPAALGDEIRNAYLYFGAHTTDDVREIPIAFLREVGVSIRGQGGVYFVPDTFKTQLEAVQRVVQRCGPNQTFTLPIVDSVNARTTMSVVAADQLGEEIRQIEAALDKFRFDGAKKTTLAHQLEDFAQLRAKVGMFASLLSMRSSSLTERLDQMTQIVRHYMNGGTAETAPTFEKKNVALPKEPEVFDKCAGF